MDSIESSGGSSRSETQLKDDEERNLNEIPLVSSSFVEELRRDDVSYSYASTWSTNYTMSNLEGAGRIIGNLYSRAGSSLEKGLGSLAYRARLGSYAKLKNHSPLDVFDSEDTKEHEKACKILLNSARSHDLTEQLDAFKWIVDHSVRHPSKVRSAFRAVFEQRKEISDAITFSWRRQGIEYTTYWLFKHKLASRCLSTHESSFLEVQSAADHFKSLDFSDFEGLILNSTQSTCF
ncbi:hypothetical protein SCHPADRAFT_515012 [Schizopora paradoxa]|uniref:Uncharacterized protein n=1 Tax=Schizopora paradoxa TaxID=27342 RepID=A0A0H2RF76_9AGAM|nr:hypothetical protein SCHPADRAFT_515012 [Schizopora paradoxa]